MAVEIERKFLVAAALAWAERAPGVPMKQGYLASTEGCAVRVRVAGPRAFLTIKGATKGISRAEFEYEIPVTDAEEMLMHLCVGSVVSKVRYEIPVGDHTWEVDVFEGDNAGLVVAEIELSAEDEAFERPEWVGREVSDDRRYQNASLSREPYCRWRGAETC